MNCPKCDSEIKDNYCENCKKALDEVYLKLIEETQVERDYKKTMQYINILSKITDSETMLEELSCMRERMELSGINNIEFGSKMKDFRLSVVRIIVLIFILFFMLLVISTIVLEDKYINELILEIFKVELGFEIKKEIINSLRNLIMKFKI